ncbi:MAG TPA: hypothetical protein VGZ29_03370 [Terriglobia bacterium]|nr:hypothetical protein [Terriglobia bacterium]
MKKIIENYSCNETTGRKRVPGRVNIPCPRWRIFSLWWLLSALTALLITMASVGAAAQARGATEAAGAIVLSSDSVVPRLIRFSGTIKDAGGKPVTSSLGLTFSLYQFEEGGRPLWVETQTVLPDSQGHYSVLLGAASADGLPQDLFSSGSARWLGVQPALPGAGEQPRVLLVGVPYALKAADAETLGGKPASAYVTTEVLNAQSTSKAPGSAMPAIAASAAAGAQDHSTSAGAGGRKNASAVNPPTSCSSITADGTATANQLAKFTAACKIHQSLLFDNGTDVGVNTNSPAATLDVNGNISGRDNLGLPQTTKSSVGVITLGGSSFLHACCSSSADNTFLGVKAGNFTMSGVGHNTATGFDALFANTTGGENTASGYFALSANTTGSSNTADGHEALELNTSGFNNTAVGFSAMLDNGSGTDNTAVGDSVLNFNTTGSFNTAVGETALGGNTTGKFNTALGTGASVSPGTVINATAIGAEAIAGESNAIVLGCTSSTACSAGGLNPGAVPPNVGIGTGAPVAPLDINGNLLQTLIGDPGCGSGFAGIAFQNTALSNCQNYALIGDSQGDTFVQAPGSGATLHLRISPNKDAMTLADSGVNTIFGSLNVTGTLTKGSGSFKIDDPLDPANKYLYHSFVESPDMMDIYNGNVTTNKQGVAIVVLPAYFQALNRDFRYQLTPIGQFAQVIVARKIANNRFVIRTSKPGVEVSWQVTGIRHDAFANAHRIPVEEEKPPREQGKYLHPELFGARPEEAVGYSAPPAVPAPVPAPVASTVSTSASAEARR